MLELNGITKSYGTHRVLDDVLLWPGLADLTAHIDFTAIALTAQEAGLDVLGGGRVTTHVCGYCGAELDALENYRMLRRFAEMPRPETPLKIGAEGRILGQSWRVIGVLGQSESWRGRSWHGDYETAPIVRCRRADCGR